MRAPLTFDKSRRQISDVMPLPAPTGGWDAVSSLANMAKDHAVVLDNWIPRPGYIEMRRGYTSWGTGLGSGVVDSLMAYHATTAASSKLFAGANNKIYNVTSSGAGTDQSLTMTSNRYQHTNFTTSGGKYLWICNGSDAPRHYDGSAWATPSLTVTTYSSSDIVNVHPHGGRLWFVFKNSTVGGYLASGAIAGTVTNFEFGNVFNRGGYLVAIATWARDGGTGGSDDVLVAISSQGQCAIYAGSDPNDSQLWTLQGVFDLGPPIGYRCFTKVGDDLAIITIDGVVPIKASLAADRGAAARVAITGSINDAMNQSARNYKSNFGWQLKPYPKGTYVVLNVPVSEGVTQYQYIMNTLTGAWCRFTGQNANCWEVLNDTLYFGGNAGVVYKADTGGKDGTAAITATGQCAYNYLRQPGRFKSITLLEPLITADSDLRPALGMSSDFSDNEYLSTPAAASSASALWDISLWDAAVWPTVTRAVTDWTTASANGTTFSIHFRAQTSSTSDTTIRLNGFNVGYEMGGVL